MKTMKAAVLHKPDQMTVEGWPVPKVGANDLLVGVAFCGFCGSDVAYLTGEAALGHDFPFILGHELTGRVVAVGKNAKGKFAEGDWVVVNPVQSCGKCEWCLSGRSNVCSGKMRVPGVSVHGGFAEYCLSDFRWTVKLKGDAALQIFAMTEPLACVTHALNRLDMQPGMTLAIIGAGVAGFMMVQLAKAQGAGTVFVVGRRDYRLRLCKQVGAEYVLEPNNGASPFFCSDVPGRIKELTHGRMADRAYVATSSPKAIAQALAVTGRGAIVVLYGLPGSGAKVEIPYEPFLFGEQSVVASWLAPESWPAAIDAIERGVVDLRPLISKVIPLEQAAEGILALKERTDEPMKILVDPKR